LKLKHNEPLSNFAFNCNRRPYTLAVARAARGRGVMEVLARHGGK